MTNTFKNARGALTSSMTTFYTCPASTTAIIMAAEIVNIDGSVSADVTAQWLDSSASNTATKLAHLIPVPANSKIDTITKKLVLEAGDALQMQANANSLLVTTISIMEIS